jgi:5-methylcytosine-specific restriction enzyme B
MGVAPPDQRMLTPDLQQLVLDEPADGIPEERGRRAWLVRGSNVQGFSLVGDWLVDGYCSLPAAKLRELPAGVSRDDVRKAVEEDYDSTGHPYRAA